MKSLLFLAVLVQVCCFAYAQEALVTAVRKPNQDYHQFLKSYKFFSGAQATLSTSDIPDMQDWSQVQDSFEAARDRRNLRWTAMPKFLRRTTFLYPQDGCFLRAALMNRALMAQFIAPLPKIYVFGN